MSDQSTEVPRVTKGSGWVVIQHSKTGGFAEVTRQAFDLNYSKNGWAIVAEYDTTASTPSAQDSTRQSSGASVGAPPAPVAPAEKKEV